MKIVAKGKKYNEIITIEVTKINNKIIYLFNNKPDGYLLYELMEVLKTRPLMYGTFKPVETESELNIYNVLRNYFFDELISIKDTGMTETLPYEPGRIY